MPPLADRLRERIAAEGSIPFTDFMAAALYDPDGGYYSRLPSIGEGGDFLTSPHVTPAFAATLARVFSAEADSFPGPVAFVEIGAGNGRFLEDFAGALRSGDPGLHARTAFTAVEATAAGRAAIAARDLDPAPRIVESVEVLEEGSVEGWIFSNELYDALPVARVVGTEGGLREVRVSARRERFVWEASPAEAPPELAAHLARFDVTLEPGQAGEVALGAAPLHRRLARALRRGWLVAFDYGHPARILYHPFARRDGTLAVHSGGRRGGDPLEDPGSRDLTAHVNWDDLLSSGEAEGLRTEHLMRQGLYLTEAGIFDFARNDGEKWRIFRLVDPGGMGEEISVLIQSRGVTTGAATL